MTAVVVGGAQEALEHDSQNVRIILRQRKGMYRNSNNDPRIWIFLFLSQANLENKFISTGFIKLALRCGADLLPSFAFGEQLIYNYPNNDAGKYIANSEFYRQTRDYI